MWACLLQFIMFTTVFGGAGNQGIKCQQRIFEKMVVEAQKERMICLTAYQEKKKKRKKEHSLIKKDQSKEL